MMLPGSVRCLLAAALLTALCIGCRGEVEHPNLVLITVDTLRADRMSLYGYERETTPALERWARDGTVFERALAPSSWTLPSMSILMTGQVRIRTAGKVHPGQRSLAEHLAASGYRTAAVFSNGLLDRENGFDRGFERFQVFKPRTREEKARPWTADEVSDRGLEALEGLQEPFFLALHYSDPHSPYAPLEGLAFQPLDDPRRRQAFRDALPPEHRDELTDTAYRLLEQASAAYDSEVLQTDRHIARVLDWLERKQLSDRTLVVLTADHGEGLGQRARNPDERLGPGPLGRFYLEHGVQLYDEQVRVPLAFVGPQVPAGVRVPGHVALVDVVPTILTLLRLPLPPELHGRLLAFDATARQARPVFAYCSRGTIVTVDDRWRLHVPRDYRANAPGVEPELYDLEADPLEREPIRDPDRIEALRQQVEAWRGLHITLEEGRDLPPSLEEQRRKLAAMGYVWDDLFRPLPVEQDPPVEGILTPQGDGPPDG